MINLPNHYSKIVGSAIVMLALIAVGASSSSSYTMLMSDAGVAYATTRDIILESTVKISDDMIRDGSPAADDTFGASSDVLGDLDGDGTTDFVVGAPGTFACVCSGEVYVLFMNDDGTVRDTATINSHTPNGPSVQAGDRFGVSLSTLGDLGGDGTVAIAVGAPSYSAHSITTGDVYIIFLNPDGTVKRTTEINSGTPNGPELEDGDQFGRAISNLGDLDNDGVNDIAVGAPGHNLHSVHTGDVFLMFMNLDGTVKRTTEINSDTPNGPSELGEDDEFGISVSAIGDLDGDGVTEIAVGAAGSPTVTHHEGSLYIMFMRPDGTVKSTSVIGPDTPNGPNLMSGDSFGEAAAGISDLDGDGIPEVAVGAPGQFAFTSAGDVYILMMNSNGTIKSTTSITADTPNGPMLDDSDHFGTSIHNMGDIDNNGIDDLMVGTRGDATLHIILLNADGTPKATTTLHGGDVIQPVHVPHNNFGWSVVNIGDLDGDGTADIVVGVPGMYVGGSSTGHLNILFMNSNGTVKSATLIDGNTPNAPSLAIGDRFGSSVSNMGDLDNDGTPEIIVGAPGHILGTESTGDAYILFMNNDATIKHTVDIGASTAAHGLALVSNDRFGESVSVIGDLDNDGTPEIIVGAPGHGLRGVATGDAYIIFLNPDGTPKHITEINGDVPAGPAIASGDRFGWSSAGIGDFDGDGTSDIVVGAPGHPRSDTITGTIHIILLNSDGTPKTSIAIDNTTANGPSSLLVPGDRFGTSVGAIGDLDNDGIAEIAVGAPGLGVGLAVIGKVHILFPNPDGTLKDSAVIDSTTPNGPILVPGERFGPSVNGLGDLDGNGTPDIIVGTANEGTLHVMFTSTKQTIDDNPTSPGTATITGTIFSDLNINGIHDAGESGIPGYRMLAIDLTMPDIVLETVTDAAGTYTFSVPTPSPAILVQTTYFPFDHTITTGPFYAYVQPETGGQTITFDAGFSRVSPSEYVTLDVRVYRDENANGQRDSAETAVVQGATINVHTYTTNQLQDISTGSDGTASKTDIIAADFLAQVVVPEGYVSATSPVDPASGVAGALTVVGPTPGTTIPMEIGLVPIS